jgi:hypothetical protein
LEEERAKLKHALKVQAVYNYSSDPNNPAKIVGLSKEQLSSIN